MKGGYKSVSKEYVPYDDDKDEAICSQIRYGDDYILAVIKDPKTDKYIGTIAKIIKDIEMDDYSNEQAIDIIYNYAHSLDKAV